MNNTTIKLNDYLTLNSGVTPEEGTPVYNSIIEAFKKGEVVILDFEGVDMLTTAFLNVVIGDLYKDYSSEKLKSMLVLVNYSEQTAKRIKKVTDNAKLFYKDESSYRKEVEEVLNGSN